MPVLRTAKEKHHPKSACLLTLTVLAPRRPTQSIGLWAGDTGAKRSGIVLLANSWHSDGQEGSESAASVGATPAR